MRNKSPEVYDFCVKNTIKALVSGDLRWRDVSQFVRKIVRPCLSRRYAPNGARECARRRRQMEKSA